jgi:GntR family carbon starvation induced transcriptional regulator
VTGTISGWVYAQLRSDILAADLPPGGKLRIDALCARYGVTSTPMREALNQLASEGFVQRLEQRGFIVLPASAQELEQLTQTRCWVEAIALREAIAHRSAAWEAMLGECWQELSDTPRSTESGAFVENPAWEGVHRRFHMALIATCPSHWLITFCGQLSDHAMRYRRLAMSTAFPHRSVAEEHRAILDAALAGDTDAAVAQLEAHYRRTAGIVMAWDTSDAEETATG